MRGWNRHRCREIAVPGMLLLGAVAAGMFSPVAAPAGTCVMERETTPGAGAMVRRLPESCTVEERRAHAVSADDVMAALAVGRNVELDGVHIVGDALLDRLPVVSAATIMGHSDTLDGQLLDLNLREVRVITSRIAIRNARVRGTWGTNLKQGLVVFTQPITATGTTFEGAVDFSLAAFLQTVDFSRATFQRQAFFIQSLFDKPARFEHTSFGPHSRFHRARFAGSVTFRAARFNGLAEFLEVTFGDDANLSKTFFQLGTGFSGSRFAGAADFTDAEFHREAFFTFTIFERDAVFTHAAFRGVADFSDASFRGLDEFSKTHFTLEPNFTRTKVSTTRPTPPWWENPTVLYGISALLGVATLVLVLRLRRT